MCAMGSLWPLGREVIECVGRREAQGRGGGQSWGSEEEYVVLGNVWVSWLLV